MINKLQRFNIYELVTLIKRDDLLSSIIKNPLSMYLSKRNARHVSKLKNDKTGLIIVSEQNDDYLLGSYTVLPDENNNFFRNVTLSDYIVSEGALKQVGGYFVLFYLDFRTGKLFFQELPEAPSFKSVFNDYLNSKKVFLENVLVENPKEAVTRFFKSLTRIEINRTTIGMHSTPNDIVNINKKIDEKIVMQKEVYTIKTKCKFNVEEFMSDLLEDLNYEEYSTLKVYGHDIVGKNINYDIIKDSILRKIDMSINLLEFSIEKNKEYVLQVFKELSQGFQRSSSN